MWNKRSFLMLIKIRLRGMKPRLHLCLLPALYVPYQLLLSTEALLQFVPLKYGAWLRLAVDTLEGFCCMLMWSEPQRLVDADIDYQSARIRVLIVTCGLKGGGRL